MTQEELRLLLLSKLSKEAGSPIEEIVASTVHLSNPVGQVGSHIGSLIGLLKDTEGTEKERKDITNRSALWDIIPGVSAHNMARRRKSLSKELSEGAGYRAGLSESLGGITSTVLGALIGGGLGAAFTALARKRGWDWALTSKANYKPGGVVEYKDDPSSDYLAGTLAGASVGGSVSLLANLLAGPASIVTERRDKEAQREYENSKKALAANYLLPGVAPYNAWKTQGYLQGEAEKVRS